MFNQRGREACESGFQDHAFAAFKETYPVS